MTSLKQEVFAQQARLYRKIALVGYLGLLAFVLAWHYWLHPHPQLGVGLRFVLFILPLLLPLRGILKGNPYTHAWANFILMLYFLHSLTSIYILWGEDSWYLPWIELILTSIAFIGATYYARYKGRELGLSIRKKRISNAGKID